VSRASPTAIISMFDGCGFLVTFASPGLSFVRAIGGPPKSGAIWMYQPPRVSVLVGSGLAAYVLGGCVGFRRVPWADCRYRGPSAAWKNQEPMAK
jgi:hypothetical protein